jgi:hypothetical protein
LLFGPSRRPRNIGPIIQDFGLGEVVTVTKQIHVTACCYGKYTATIELETASLVKPVILFRLNHQLFYPLAGQGLRLSMRHPAERRRFAQKHELRGQLPYGYNCRLGDAFHRNGFPNTTFSWDSGVISAPSRSSDQAPPLRCDETFV